MPVVWCRVELGSPLVGTQRVEKFEVFGAAEAEEFAERLRAYGRRPIEEPKAGDKGVLILHGIYVVWPGCVKDVWVDPEPKVPEYQTIFTEYDPLIHENIF